MLSNKQAPICSIQTKNLQEEIKAKTYVGKRFIINNKYPYDDSWVIIRS